MGGRLIHYSKKPLTRVRSMKHDKIHRTITETPEPPPTREQELSAALLWARNHLDCGDPTLKDRIIERLDKILEDSGSITGNHMRALAVKYPLSGATKMGKRGGITLVERVERLERAVKELNPGLDI